MKKILVAVALALYASTASAVIAGSAHDLTAIQTGNGFPAASCSFCHIPHFGSTATAGLPLWARANNTSVTYTMYPTTLGGTTPAATPGANSLTCLSCHDGTADIGATTRADFSGTDVVNISPGNNVGTSLTDDHPIAIVHTAGRAGLVSTAQAQSNGLKLYGATNNTVECGSCHDPHDTTLGFFLRTTTPADICAACHTNK